VDRRERTYTIPCAEAPAFVEVDSDFGVLAEITLKAPRSMLLAALREDPGVVGRIRAARALVKDGHVQALAAVRAALVADAFWGVRAELADLLGARGAAEDVDALVRALADAHPKARRRVVSALGGTRSPVAAEALTALGAADPDASVQVEGEVARALARLRAPAARARCEALLSRDSWGEVLRARAIEGLGMLRDASVLPLLLAQAADEAHPRVRAAACSALARLGDEVDATRTEVVERLVKLAEDPNYRVQVAAINALGGLRDTRALGVLGRVHASAGDGRARRLAFEAMASIREGRTTAEGLAGLRREVEGLVEDNRKLRARVEKVEARPVS